MKIAGYLLLSLFLLLFIYFAAIEDTYIKDGSTLSNICEYLFIGLLIIIPLFNIIYYLKIGKNSISKVLRIFGLFINLLTYLYIFIFFGIANIEIIPESIFIGSEFFLILAIFVLPFFNLLIYWKIENKKIKPAIV